MRGVAHAVFGRALGRFVLIGTVNTVVDVAVYSLLVLAGLPVVSANLVSTSCGLVVSYLLNSRFVFRTGPHATRRAALRRIALFVLTTGLGLWVLQPLVIVACTGVLRSSGLRGLALVLLPKLAATCVTLVWNYVLYSLVVFAGGRAGAIVPAAAAMTEAVTAPSSGAGPLPAPGRSGSSEPGESFEHEAT